MSRIFIELTAINLDAEKQAYYKWQEEQEEAQRRARRPALALVSGGDEDAGPEEDDLERPIPAAASTQPEAEAQPQPEAKPVFVTPESATYPVTIYEDQIRDFHTRQGENRVGTRVVYIGGSAQPVYETYEQVKQKIQTARNAARRGTPRE